MNGSLMNNYNSNYVFNYRKIIMKKYIEFNNKKYVRFSYLMKNREKCIFYIDRKKFKTLDEEIIFFLDKNDKNEYIIIPASYEFDFNSSPCFTHCIVDVDEFCIALIHDYLYWRNWTVYIKDENNKSNIFKKLERYWHWISYDVLDSYYEFLYNRKFADKVWLLWAKVEKKEIERKNEWIKCFLWYLWIRIWWCFCFRKK